MAKKKDEELLDFLNEAEVLKEMKNKELSDEDKANFIKEMKNNWFLDSDSINFLIENNIDFFTFNDSECFCLSRKKFNDCCLLKLNQVIDKNYVCSYESLKDKELWNKYLIWSKSYINNIKNDFNKKRKCLIPNCNNNAIKSNLYSDINGESYFSSVKENFLDIMSIMGTIFFDKNESAAFDFYSLCSDHDNESKISEEEAYNLNKPNYKYLFRALAFKEYLYTLKHLVLTKEYIDYSNSIELEGYKKLMVYQIKKIISELSYVKDFIKSYSEVFKNEKSTALKTYEFNVSGQDNFKVRDVVHPQIMPENYEAINSSNNLFVKSRFGIMNTVSKGTKTKCYIVIDSSDTKLVEYMEYWNSKISDKTKDCECFITNMALINTDNILISKHWFDTLENTDKVVISMFHKIRFDSPQDGKELLTMQMLSNLNRGNNFFDF